MLLSRLFLSGLIFSVFVSSCVSTKRLTYLQENEKGGDSLIALSRVNVPYRIQTSDLLVVKVKALDQEVVEMFNTMDSGNHLKTDVEDLYFNGLTVDVRGNIRIPTLGEVFVLGYTVDEVRQKLEKNLLEKHFTDEANLFVSVKLAGIRYSTIGEVSPGNHILFKDQVNILEAIAHAGDITSFGDRRNVVIVRKYPGGEQSHQLDLTDFKVVNSPYYYIQPNDIIIVNPLPQKSLGFGMTGMENFRTLTTVFTFATTFLLLLTQL